MIEIKSYNLISNSEYYLFIYIKIVNNNYIYINYVYFVYYIFPKTNYKSILVK